MFASLTITHSLDFFPSLDQFSAVLFITPQRKQIHCCFCFVFFVLFFNVFALFSHCRDREKTLSFSFYLDEKKTNHIIVLLVLYSLCFYSIYETLYRRASVK